MVNLAYAMGGGGQAAGAQGGGSMLMTILPLALMFGIFYVLLIRPQQKKAKEQKLFLDNLKKGDRVITAGGIIGEITGLTDQSVTLEIAEKIRVKVGRGYIGGLAPKEGGKNSA